MWEKITDYTQSAVVGTNYEFIYANAPNNYPDYIYSNLITELNKYYAGQVNFVSINNTMFSFSVVAAPGDNATLASWGAFITSVVQQYLEPDASLVEIDIEKSLFPNIGQDITNLGNNIKFVAISIIVILILLVIFRGEGIFKK